MPKFKLEEFLLPHEHDGEGKKLDEPKELDVEQLRKWAYALLKDKEEAQEARDTAIAQKENAENDLEELRKKNESDEERRAREEKEREKRYEKLEREATERRKLDVITEAFEKEGITAAQAKRLARRVQGDEKDWVADAKELVEDGFKVGVKVKEKDESVETDDDLGDDVRAKPVRRSGSDGPPPPPPNSKPRSVADELDAAGIFRQGW